MRVLIYSLNYAPEPVGIGKYSGELGSWLSLSGHEVKVVAGQPYFPAWNIKAGYKNVFQKETIESVEVYRCPLWIPKKVSGLTRLLHLTSFAVTSAFVLLGKRRWNPDWIIVIAPSFFCTPAALLFSKLSKGSTLTWLHIQDFELDAAFQLGILKGAFLRKAAESLERLIFRPFTRVSSISHAMVNRLAIKGVLPAKRILFPNWVDLETIFPLPVEEIARSHYRKSLNIPTDAIILMYSGSMNQKQGLEILVESITLLSDLANVYWFIAGDGPTKNSFVTQTEKFPNVYHFPLQPVEQMNIWLNSADIHLLPQKSGAADLVLPSKLLGMLASGKPVVATSPPQSELSKILNGAGACTTPGVAKDFALALRTFIINSDLRSKCGLQARLICENNFAKSKILNEFEKLLLELDHSIK